MAHRGRCAAHALRRTAPVVKRLYAFLDFIRLGRPLFLVGGFLLYGLGVAIALYQGATVRVPVLIWGQVAITAIHVMTHYSNDYFDLAADEANLTPTAWAGGSRMLPEGRVRPQLALAAALFFAGLALLATAALSFRLRTGPFTLPLLLLALLLAWSYSAPPLRLHSRGVGEATVALLVPGLVPLVGYYLQAGRLTWLPLLAVVPLALLQFMMLLAIEFPDAAGDAAAGKKTLVVRLEPEGAARLLQSVLALLYVTLPLLVVAGLPLRVVISVLVFTLPAALWIVGRVRRGAWRQPRWWDWLSFTTIALLIGSTTVELIAFLSLLPAN